MNETRTEAAPHGLPQLLTVADVARALHVGRSTVYEWHRDGRLPGFRLGSGHGGLRFDLAEVRSFLESRREGQP
jgi:excisionase family DNA binding protein